MSEVRRVPWENRLGKLIGQPGGLKIADMLQRAEANLEAIRPDCIEALDRHLDEIGRLRATAGRKASPEVKDAVYRLGDSIHGLAGVFGLGDLGEAAFSLCELVDRLRGQDRWSQDAIDVHISALHLLRHPEGAGDRAAVLQGLRGIVDRFPRSAED